MKIITAITHGIDLDGWMSAAIIENYWKSKDYKVIHIGWQYGMPIPEIDKETEKVVMADICFPMDEMENIMKNFSFTWIDHHKSAIDQFEKELKQKAKYYTNFNFLLDEKKSACELTWNHYFPNTEMPKTVYYLGMYDSFRHKGTPEHDNTLFFQWAARARAYNPETCAHMLEIENINPSSFVNLMLDEGKAIKRYLDREAVNDYKRTFPVIINGYKFGSINKERFNPINFNIEYHNDGYDGYLCFWLSGKDTWSFSLYNDNGLVDCSVICKSFGGGGHFGAAGFTCNSKQLREILFS